jgi:pyruvate/2-oxoglutarate dehydrogenase complex dihydrolipoamide dehydrogenase (E3) component
MLSSPTGSPQFTHVSVDDFRIVRDNMAGGNRRTGDRLVPYVMFTDPPLARVGMAPRIESNSTQVISISLLMADLTVSPPIRRLR